MRRAWSERRPVERFSLMAIVAVLGVLAVVVTRPRGQEAAAGTGASLGDAPARLGRRTAGSGARVALGEMARGDDVVAAESVPITVVSDSGATIAGADVWVNRADALVHAATTDEAGRTQLAVERGARAVFVARAPGFAAVRSETVVPERGGVTLRLCESASILGRVQRGDGRSVSGSLSVVAVPSVLRMRFEGVPLEHVLDEPRVAVAETEVDGSFEVTGLDPGCPYTLFAGGAGFGTPVPVGDVFSGPDECVVEVERLYGVIVELREPEGALAHLARAVGGGASFELRVLDPLARGTDARLLAVRLNGVPIEPARLPADRKMYVFWCGTDPPELGPLELRARPIGYAGIEVPLRAQPLANGWSTQTVTLLPDTTGRGVVHIEVPGIEDLDGSGMPGPVAIVHVDGGQRGTFEMPVPEIRSGGIELSNLPHGTYRMRLAMQPPTFHAPVLQGGRDAVVVGDEPALAEAQLPDVGCLELRVTTPMESGYDGSLGFMLGAASGADGTVDPSEDAFSGHLVKLAGPTYRLPVLAAGAYSLGFPGADGMERLRVEVTPSSTCFVEYRCGAMSRSKRELASSRSPASAQPGR